MLLQAAGKAATAQTPAATFPADARNVADIADSGRRDVGKNRPVAGEQGGYGYNYKNGVRWEPEDGLTRSTDV